MPRQAGEFQAANQYFICHLSGGTGGAGGSGGKEGGDGGAGQGPMFQATSMQVVIQSPEDREIINWVSPLNFFPRQADILKARQPGTGEWFLQDHLFKKWRAGEIHALWCRGIPGAGKTVLASIVVDDLRTNVANETTGVAVLYLDHKAAAEAHSPRNLLAAIWQQLIIQEPISSDVHRLYNKHYAQGTRPSLEETYSLLHSAIEKFSDIFIVVDALDEYPEEERDTLLRHLGNLGPAVRLMLTSRPHVSIDHGIPTIATVDVRATEEDIRRYVEGQIEKSRRLARHMNKSSTLRELIEENIVKRSDGMFLLAKLHIDSLMTKQNVAAVKEALTNLSSNLDGAYDAIVNRINQQSEDDRQLAFRTLLWVVHAKAPLRPSQLKEALAVEPGATTLDPDRQTDIDIILSLCAGLVVVEEAEDQVRLVHYTTQTYFDLAPVQTRLFPRAQCEITLTCITYMSLTFETFSEMLSYTSLLFTNPFLHYTVEYCLIHARGDPETDIKHPLMTFLDNYSEQWWRLWHWPLDPQSTTNKVQIARDFDLQVIHRHIIDEDGVKLLQNAVLRGATDEVRMLLEYGVSIENELLQAVIHDKEELLSLLLTQSRRQNNPVLPCHEFKNRYGAALYHASWTGNEGLIKLLIEHGADVNSPCKEYDSVQGGAAEACHALALAFGLPLEHGPGSALQAAVSTGHEAVVHLLLQHGADVNAKAGKYGNVLQLASWQGHEVIARLLVEHGADLHADGGEYGSALQAASEKGHEVIVKLLLERGADATAQNGIALRVALQTEHDSIVKLLLEHWQGPDANAIDWQDGSALQAATEQGHEAIVKLLLEHGADVNQTSFCGDSALQAASKNGREAVVKLLLEHGADVNPIYSWDYSALQAASEEGHDTIVKLLLDQGADVNALDGRALHVASHEGHEAIVALLLEHGADVSAWEGGALCVASHRGHEAIVKLLLEHGADVNALDGGALCVASHRGHEAIVKLLLEHGADIDAKDWDGSVLKVASEEGHEAVVKLILEHGADVNALDGGTLLEHGADVNQTSFCGDSALQAASKNGRKAVVKLLLEHGADVNPIYSWDYSALQVASEEGHDTIVKLLLDQGANVNALDGRALRVASHQGHEAIVALLLEHGADVSAWEGGALCVASLRGHEAIVKLLLEHGADVDAKDWRRSALQAASEEGHEAVVKLLLEHGADVDAKDWDRSALQAASEEGHEAVVKLLLEHGADVNALDGGTLYGASLWGHEAIVKLLLEHGAHVSAEEGGALRIASEAGREDIVKLLLEHGANATRGGRALYVSTVPKHRLWSDSDSDSDSDLNEPKTKRSRRSTEPQT
ncbi:ankyrin repeat-containing domain protein [Mycena leptocephala]|nr:ankyrin repeat-containing domain protein [Mycena leptocephala]